MSTPALFLDRDGVINEERNYVHKIADFVFMAGIFELCRSALLAKQKVIVVTNQAGIGRGLYTQAQYDALTRWMCAQFASSGCPLSAVYHCPTHPEFGRGGYKAHSPDRKPAPGMILRAAQEHDVDLSVSAIIGDRCTDMIAGQAAGLKHRLLIIQEDTKVQCTSATAQVCSLAHANDLLYVPHPNN